MKKWLDLARINSKTNAVESLVRVILNEDGTIEMQGDQALISHLNERGLESRHTKDFIYPEDGELFFTTLNQYYDNPMVLQATDIHEDDNVPLFKAA